MIALHSDLTRADIAQRTLRLQGEPYSLKTYPMFLDIFNSNAERVLMRSGRQVSKTVSMAANIMVDVEINPYYPVIYANSSAAQTQSFSTSKLDPFLIHSPIVYHNLMGNSKHIINNVYNKRLANFSEIHLKYFSESADRVRGLSGNKMYLDEVQDMLYDAMIDAEECLSAASNPTYTYAGTSKSMGTPLEYFWELSSKKEWIIPCRGCGIWNRPYLEIIGKEGLRCKKCSHELDTFEGRWHSFYKGEDPPLVDGYWVPQIILPLHCKSPKKWESLLSKKRNYPESKFLNEIMGLPLGEGDKLITEEMLKSICIDSLQMEPNRNPRNAEGAQSIVAGIDWGGGGGNGLSRTVMSVYAVYPERDEYIKIYGKIFGGGEPSGHIIQIAQIARAFGCTMIFGDHGGGHFAMSQLRNAIPDIRVVPVMYTEQARPLKWDEETGRYTVNRTTMIDSLIGDIKMKKVRAFNWGQFEEFAQDLLNVHEEIIGEQVGKPKRVWRRHPSKPDDSLHSMVFGWLAARVMAAQLDFKI